MVLAARTVQRSESRLAGTLGDTAREIERAGGRAVMVPTDLSSPAARHDLVSVAEHAAGPVRFSTGLAAEVYDDGISVNALSPALVVPTPGTVFHELVRPDDPGQQLEQPEVMAQAALEILSAAPLAITGRVVTSAALLEEIG